MFLVLPTSSVSLTMSIISLMPFSCSGICTECKSVLFYLVLFFSIVYHLHKMYLSCASFFHNLERWLGDLVLQYDAFFFFFFAFPIKIWPYYPCLQRNLSKEMCVCMCVCAHIYDYMWFVIRNCLLQLWNLKNPNMHRWLADGDRESQRCGSSLKGCR